MRLATQFIASIGGPRGANEGAILSGSFTPGALSTPDETSTPPARGDAHRLRDIAGIEPAREHERKPRSRSSSSASRTAGRGRRDGWRPSARGHRTGCGRRPRHSRRSARSALVSTASPSSPATRIALDVAQCARGLLAVQLQHVGLQRLDDMLERLVVGVDRERHLARTALHPPPSRARIASRDGAATAERTRSRPFGAGVERGVERLGRVSPQILTKTDMDSSAAFYDSGSQERMAIIGQVL